MKSINLVLGLLLATSVLMGQNFVTEWETTSGNESITITVNNPNNSKVNYSVDWGDNVTNTEVSGSITHTYANS